MLDIRDLRGVDPYLPTPFTPEGAIDEAALKQLADHLVRSGAHGVTPLGPIGEFAPRRAAPALSRWSHTGCDGGGQSCGTTSCARHAPADPAA